MALSSEIPLAMRRRLGRSVVIYADVELRAHRKKGVLSELCESNQRDANGKESKRCRTIFWATLLRAEQAKETRAWHVPIDHRWIITR